MQAPKAMSASCNLPGVWWSYGVEQEGIITSKNAAKVSHYASCEPKSKEKRPGGPRETPWRVCAWPEAAVAAGLTIKEDKAIPTPFLLEKDEKPGKVTLHSGPRDCDIRAIKEE